jgi:hypothetical protein
VVGNVGARQRVEYTVLGHEVNRAQCLEVVVWLGILFLGLAIWEAVVLFEACLVGEVYGKCDERIPAWELAGPGAEPPT